MDGFAQSDAPLRCFLYQNRSINTYNKKEAVCTASLIFASLRDLLPPGGNNIFVLSDVGYDMFNKLIILSFC